MADGRPSWQQYHSVLIRSGGVCARRGNTRDSSRMAVAGWLGATEGLGGLALGMLAQGGACSGPYPLPPPTPRQKQAHTNFRGRWDRRQLAGAAPAQPRPPWEQREGRVSHTWSHGLSSAPPMPTHQDGSPPRTVSLSPDNHWPVCSTSSSAQSHLSCPHRDSQPSQPNTKKAQRGGTTWLG